MHLYENYFQQKPTPKIVGGKKKLKRNSFKKCKLPTQDFARHMCK